MTPEDPRMEFLSTMAAALSRYGETADSLESGLQACARTLGVEVAFFSVPTAVFVAYGHGAAMHTVLLHTRDSAIDLQALSLLDETLLDVTSRAHVRRPGAGRGQARHGQPAPLSVVHARAGFGRGRRGDRRLSRRRRARAHRRHPRRPRRGRALGARATHGAPHKPGGAAGRLRGGGAHPRPGPRAAALPPRDGRAGRADPAAARPQHHAWASPSWRRAISSRGRRGSPARRSRWSAWGWGWPWATRSSASSIGCRRPAPDERSPVNG